MGELKAPGKPFEISKWAVWEAWEKVKANKGAPGVDGQSIAEFEKDLKGNLYKIWNRMSSGSYFPPPVRAVEIPKAHGAGTTGQRHPAPPRYQWLLASPRSTVTCRPRRGPCSVCQHGTVAPVDLTDADAVLGRQRLGQRPFHDVLEPAEPVAVERQLVVLHDAPVLGLVLGDDAEIRVDGPFGRWIGLPWCR